jgi:hypothetical protein
MNKTCLVSLSVAVAVISCSSHDTKITKSVQHHGNDMNVQAHAVINGRKVYDYDKTFDVSGLSKQQKDSLYKHVTDSLDQSTDQSGK